MEPSTSRRSIISALGLLPFAQAFGQGNERFPSRPIQLLVGYIASSTDTIMRALAADASNELKQAMVVLNQPGVSGTLAPTNLLRAAPDGYTIAFVPSGLFRLPHMQKVAYEPLNDFTYIIGVYSTCFGFNVKADARWQTLADLLDAARAQPDKVSFGGVGAASPAYFALHSIAVKTGFRPTYVPFKGGSDLFAALFGGHIDCVIEGGFGPYLEGRQTRCLAVLERERVPLWPEVPTAVEAGFDITTNAVSGIAGPKGMHPRVVKVLHDAFHHAMTATAFQRMLRTYGNTASYMDSERYQRHAVEAFAQEKRNVADAGLSRE